MVTKRRENGFNLAFLDVMACGLGAVLLILIIVNFNDDTPIPSDEIEKLEQELAATENQSQFVSTSVSAQASQTSIEQANASEQATQIAQLAIQQKSLQRAIAEKKAVLADLADAVAAIAPQTAADLIDLPSINEETYLLGLIVEGRRIGILVDTSASMTDESLIDIIKRKFSNDSVKKAGPKWQRTLRIVKWMLARLPDNSQVAVVSFNNKASALGSPLVSSAKVSTNIQKLVADINALVPQNGTNLQEGLAQLQRTMPDMTDLYVITDGLPSLISASSGFSPSRACNPLPGQQATITGACRVEVMQRTLRVN
ncbi:MAG: hypothetical protein ACI9RV_002998, partial [Glaciecola sp.]